MLVIRGVSKWHTAGKPAGRACRTAVPLQPPQGLGQHRKSFWNRRETKEVQRQDEGRSW